MNSSMAHGKYIGPHVSISGGVEKASLNAKKLGATGNCLVVYDIMSSMTGSMQFTISSLFLFTGFFASGASI